jgi:hypothetical protein
VASTTKSVLLTTKSPSWTTPSPSLSTTLKRPAGAQSVTHLGRSETLEPTRLLNTAFRAKDAYAGAVK